MGAISQADYLAMLARTGRAAARGNGVGCEREGVLHEQIAAECDRRGWIALHSRMDRSTGRTLGEPDFVILGDGGRVLLIECKTARGKLSVEQLALHAMARHLGHEVWTVRSFEEFLNLLLKPNKPQ